MATNGHPPIDPLALLEGAPLALVALDRAGKVVFWNAAAERLTGWSAAEVLGRPAPYIPQDMWDAFLARHEDAFTSELPEVPAMTVRRQRRDGEWRELHITRARIRGADGETQCVLGVLEDVTRKLLDEAEKRRSEANLRALIEHAPDAIIVHRQGYVVFVNPAFVRLSGWSTPEELIGRSMLSFVPPHLRDAVNARLEMLRNNQSTPPMEQILVRRDGSEVHVEVRGIPILFDGEPAGVAHVRDLTERMRLETQLRMADRLASVGRLAAAVGHEINNPLTYVIGNLGAIAARVDASLAPDAAREVRELLAEVRDGAERVRRIVRDLKLFSARERDERTAVDVLRVLDSCASMAGNEIRHRARLVKRYGDVPRVLGNEARLGQVFLNLLVNAAQAIPEDDSEELARRGIVHEVSIDVQRGDGDSVVVEVRDTGVGIPPELAPRLFEPFVTTKPSGQGTGLGLAISHSLVTAMSGTIEVKSELGKGTCVRVTLPAAPADAPVLESPVPAPPSSQTQARRRVLVVDDDARVARAIARALSMHDVTVATSGREALDRIARGDFDAVVCDLMMPDVSGMELFEAAAAACPPLKDRFVFMSGGAFTPRATEFLARVKGRCLEKPFSPDALERALAKVLEQES